MFVVTCLTFTDSVRLAVAFDNFFFILWKKIIERGYRDTRRKRKQKEGGRERKRVGDMNSSSSYYSRTSLVQAQTLSHRITPCSQDRVKTRKTNTQATLGTVPTATDSGQDPPQPTSLSTPEPNAWSGSVELELELPIVRVQVRNYKLFTWVVQLLKESS